MRRRVFLQWLGAAFAPGVLAGTDAGGAPVRIGLTPVFLDDQASFLRDWRAYFEQRLGTSVEFMQRGTYREIIDMLVERKLEFAWICGYPYVRNRRHLRLTGVPVFDGRPLYQSYLIVPAYDTTSRSILDLRGKAFAFSDPDSNSGFLYPRYALMQLKERPDAFFGKTFFAWAHRNVVEAVAAGLANGGAVDSYVWETLRLFDPGITDRTRVVEKSPYFGHTPFVARVGVSAAAFDRMRAALLDMSENAEGRALLKRLNLDGFIPGDDALYGGIARMARAISGRPSNAAPA
ncbi:MAG: PhnD/SsuA/transferrin family substrate-binding protein [Rhodocyclales bacterium]|nr:PhnD/SsuA/transferrin family substrate-binding protein [Rhodocyclales bacterium]